MYTEEDPTILGKIKAEEVWFKKQLENWDDIVRWIEIIPEPPLRYIDILGELILQQKYRCIVHFRERQGFGGVDTYDKRTFLYWLNVPVED